MLSSMLQGGQANYPQHPSAWGGRPVDSHSQATSALASNPFSQSSRYRQPSQRLPSPPDSMEENRETKPPSLPGFKNLLSDLQQKDEEQERHHEDSSAQRIASDLQIPGNAAIYGATQRSHFPPTPPMRPGSGFAPEKQVYAPEKQPSPPLSSFSTHPSQSIYQAPAINNLEPYNQRQMTYPPITEKRPSVTSQGCSPFSSSLQASPASAGSYQVSPIEASPSSSLLYQRPLPTNFPQPYPGHHHHMLHSYPGMPAWQTQSHHHHFPPSSIPPYSQSPDRYLCTQCNKAFSRPSSLKIHMHSHTGEKPFKCGHPGCGKAFSVRSNMKRHEKGCHGDAPGPGQFVPAPNPGTL